MFLENQWKSHSFKNKTYKNKWIDYVIDKWCSTPKIFCEYSDESMERLLFTSWFHLMPINFDYHDIPLFHDLRLIHEMCHMNLREVNYASLKSSDAWGVQIISEEIAASVMSEHRIYFDDPEIRQEENMPLQIFNDQFVCREDYFMRECMSKTQAESLWSEEIVLHKRLLASGAIRPTNDFEKKSVWYAQNSAWWTVCFQNKFREVENLMKTACVNPAEKTTMILDYLNSVSTDSIPFITEHFKYVDYVNNKERQALLV